MNRILEGVSALPTCGVTHPVHPVNPVKKYKSLSTVRHAVKKIHIKNALLFLQPFKQFLHQHRVFPFCPGKF